MTRSKASTSMKRRPRRSKMRCNLNPVVFQNMVKQAVKDIYGVTETGGAPFSFQSPALLRLQEAAEQYILIMWEQLKEIVQLSGRQELLPQDIQDWKRATGFKINHHRPYHSLNALFNSLPRKNKEYYLP